MPIYEYFCKGCNEKFERLQKMTESSNVKCPKCGKLAERQMSLTSFSLKGAGWCKDGYAKKHSYDKKSAVGSLGEKISEKKTDKKRSE